MPTVEKQRLQLRAYSIVEGAIETGLGFALNRLADITGQTLSDDERDEALEPMLNEIMVALGEVVDWERS